MADDRDRLPEAGGAALQEGDWAAAREAFAAVVEVEPGSADAQFGLGTAKWWLGCGARGPRLLDAVRPRSNGDAARDFQFGISR